MGGQGFWGERGLKLVSGGMAIFCGGAAVLCAVMVTAMLIATARFEWTGKPISWRVGEARTFASASIGKTESACQPADSRLCDPSRPREIDRFAAAMLGQLTMQTPLAALAYGLFQASAGFVGVARGRPLARRTTGRFVRFALAGLGFVLLMPNIGRLAAFIADGSHKLINMAAGTRAYQVSHYTATYGDFTSLLTMVYALALTIIALILVKASTIADDHAQIV